MILKKQIRQHISIAVLGSIITVVNLPLQASESLSEKYQRTENAFEKKQILLEIGAQQKNTTTKQARSSLRSAAASVADPVVSTQDIATIKTALNDKNATIVSEAVNCTGALKISGLDESLIDMYRNADLTYDGYAERVKISIIRAMGLNRSTTSDQFIISLLEESNGDHIATAILQTIRQTADPLFISYLKQFRSKFEQKIHDYKINNVNPIIYSEIESNVNLALEIETSISEGRK
ncbi:MAG: hypothetical protein GX639_01140 [Fibrobacter sp.]|nr:hypothetical protein [Fibrobacter sp.]